MHNMESLKRTYRGSLFKFLLIYTLPSLRILRSIGRYLVTDVDYLPLKMGPITLSITSKTNRQSMLLTFPEQRKPRPHCGESLKYRI